MVIWPEYPIAMLPFESLAVTVKVKASPAALEVGTPDNSSWVAPEASTLMEKDFEIDPEVMVIDFDPAVFRVAEKVLVPELSVLDEGRIAAESLDEKRSGLLKPVTVFPASSCAVTVKENAFPEVTLEGDVIANRDADPAFTVRVALLETAAPDTVEPMATDPEFIPVKLAVKTPEPAFVTEPKEPVPPTALEVKRMAASAGKLDGFKLP